MRYAHALFAFCHVLLYYLKGQSYPYPSELFTVIYAWPCLWAASQDKDGVLYFHYKDKMVVRPSYLYNGCKMRYLYWHGAVQSSEVSGFSAITYHYNGVIMSAMASQFTSLTIVYSTVYLGADQRKHQSSAPLAFVRKIHRWPVNSPHKGPVTRKMFPFDDVIMADSAWRLVQNTMKKDTSWICPCNFNPTNSLCI